VTGKQIDAINLYAEQGKKAEALARMERETAAGKLVQTGASGHAIVVKAVDRANRKVLIINPHGTEEAVNLDVFVRGWSGVCFLKDG